MLLHEPSILYTSFWANVVLANLDVVPVGVSRGTPRFRVPYRYRLLRVLAPSRDVFCIDNPDASTASAPTSPGLASSMAAGPWPSCASRPQNSSATATS
jgi:hypothetical protein